MALAQLVEALRYNSEGRGLDSRWCHWNFSFFIILPAGLIQPLTEIIIIIIIIFTAIGLSPGGSGYFTCIQNMKLVTTKFKSGGLHVKHVVATWSLGNHLSICFWAQGNQEK